MPIPMRRRSSEIAAGLVGVEKRSNGPLLRLCGRRPSVPRLPATDPSRPAGSRCTCRLKGQPKPLVSLDLKFVETLA